MPTVSVIRDQLFEALGKTFTDDEFQLLCFDFGIELDEVTSAAAVASRQGQKVLSPEEDYVIYKIDIPANRYDLLCIEGLITALQVFRRQIPTPKFVVDKPKHSITVTAATGQIRPYVVCAVLRGVSFDKNSYNSFLDLQDKLHFNICRRRSLVSMGTHDLAKLDLSQPLIFDARKPEDIGFVPLAQEKRFDNARELLDFYRTDPSVKHIKEYTDLIYDSPVYPVILSGEQVLSLPPIINSEFSKISEATKDVFIEITAVDENKANIVLNTMVAMFSGYCSESFHVEGVEVRYEESGRTIVTPDMSHRPMTSQVKYLNDVSGLSLPPDEICSILERMMLAATYDEESDSVTVSVPPTRSDVLHPCDVAEDMAIAFGYNNLTKRPLTTVTTGRQQPINHLTDLLRYEIAQAGFTEILSLALCSRAENYSNLRRHDDGLAVSLSNPATKEFQVCRTTLMPGILKTMRHNRALTISKGIRLFEISDVILRDESNPIGARNQRHIGALYTGPSAGFAVVHGLVDRVMELVAIDPTPEYNACDPARCTLKNSSRQYEIAYGDNPTFLPGQCADIVVHTVPEEGSSAKPEPKVVGTFGILHPEVLQAFGLEYPCSMLEMDIECLL